MANKNEPAAKALMGLKPNEREAEVRLNDLTVQKLKIQMDNGMAQIREISNYRRGLKKTTQKALREIAKLTESVFKKMSERSRNEEVYRLQTANNKLKREVDLLKEELQKIKRQLNYKGQSRSCCEEKKPEGLVQLRLFSIAQRVSTQQKDP